MWLKNTEVKEERKTAEREVRRGASNHPRQKGCVK
jgi:hypothetical protein